jgi:tryptophan-rich sensory protein
MLSGKRFPKANIFIAISVCLAAGLLGSIVTYPAISSWYVALEKPWFSPPNYLFGPVWTTLYVLKGISLYLVWKKGITNINVRSGLKLFFIQLGLNTLWSFLFFGLKNPTAAFVDIIFLWIFIYLTIQEFKKIVPVSALLLVPYFLWVTFASFLNLSIALLN